MKKTLAQIAAIALIALVVVSAVKVATADEGFVFSGYRRGVNVVTVGTATAASVTNDVILVNANSSAVTLPLASTMSGKELVVKLIAPATSGSVVYTNIDGATSYSLSASNKYVRVVSDGANYWIIANN